MVNGKCTFAIYIIQLIVTVVLLVFVNLQHNDAATNLVLGAVTTHWLKEGIYVGKDMISNDPPEAPK